MVNIEDYIRGRLDVSLGHLRRCIDSNDHVDFAPLHGEDLFRSLLSKLNKRGPNSSELLAIFVALGWNQHKRNISQFAAEVSLTATKLFLDVVRNILASEILSEQTLREFCEWSDILLEVMNYNAREAKRQSQRNGQNRPNVENLERAETGQNEFEPTETNYTNSTCPTLKFARDAGLATPQTSEKKLPQKRHRENRENSVEREVEAELQQKQQKRKSMPSGVTNMKPASGVVKAMKPTRVGRHSILQNSIENSSDSLNKFDPFRVFATQPRVGRVSRVTMGLDAI